MEVHDWLASTPASDIMVQDVVTLLPTHTLAQAATILLREQVSGAPIVDESGMCVGVLSANDVIGAEDKAARERERISNSSFWNSSLALPPSVYADKLEEIRDMIAPAAEQPVEHFMTRDVVHITEDDALITIVKYMLDAHVHRVLVLDVNQQLRGIISTTDVLAALVRVSAGAVYGS